MGTKSKCKKKNSCNYMQVIHQVDEGFKKA